MIKNSIESSYQQEDTDQPISSLVENNHIHTTPHINHATTPSSSQSHTTVIDTNNTIVNNIDYSILTMHEDINSDNNSQQNIITIINHPNDTTFAQVDQSQLMQPDINSITTTNSHHNNNSTVQLPNECLTNAINTSHCTSLNTKSYLIEDFFPQKFKNHIPQTNKDQINNNQDTLESASSVITGTNSVENNKSFRQQTLFENTKTKINEKWGSSINIKQDNNTRIYFQNINSLRYTSKASKKWQMSCQYMSDMKCDIFGFAETCIDWKRRSIKSELQKQCRSIFPNISLSFSSNQFPLSSTYLPGGSIQAAVGHWAGKTTDTIIDDKHYGRWCGQSLRLKNNETLHIITAYRPCKPTCSKRKNSRSTYNQQYLMMRKDGVKNPNPRTSFIQDLIMLIQKLEINNKNHIILMMDANESIEDSEQDIQKLLNETTLVDTFSSMNDEDCKQATHVKGNKRIDFIFTSVNMLKSVTQVGYLSFYEDNLDSDHCGSFIDLDNSYLIENDVCNKRPPKRNIGTKSSSSEKIRYLQSIDKQFSLQNIYDRCRHLLEESTNQSISSDMIESQIIKLDHQVTEIILSSEKQFCKRYYESEWSLALHYCSVEIRYWMTKFKAKRNHKDVSNKLTNLLNQLPPETKTIILDKGDSTDARSEWKRLLKYRQELIVNAKELRKKGLSELIEIRKNEGNTKAVEIIKKIVKAEMNKESWSKLTSIFKDNLKSGISYLEIPDTDSEGNITDNPDIATSWKIVSDPVSINNHLIQRNIAHFGQAQGSDFTIDPLADLFEYEGIGRAVDQLIEGTFPIENYKHDIKRGTVQLLQKLNTKNDINNIQDEISLNEWTSALRSWSESTTTSPSGRHLGHMKVCLSKIDINHSDESTTSLFKDPEPEVINFEITSMQANILNVYYTISVICLKRGISLPRWQQVTTAMIKKVPNNSKINKLRVIHLYEADYNLLLKILWARRLVWHAHDHNRLNDGQAGSRPGCNAIDIVILKEMKYLYARLTRTGLATMDNDAKSCYDRIIVTLAMIISRYFRMTPNACKLQGKTLRLMKFRLRTAIGDSSVSYNHSSSTPIHGTGQGSCASPAIWLLISSILMDCLSDIAGGMTMLDINNETSLIEWINGFVDDTSLFCNIKDDNIDKLRQQMAHDMVIWQELLEASGGKLELSKCFYYILSWKYNSDGDAIPSTIAEQSNMTSKITIHDSITQRPISIQQKETSEAHKTLGCMKSIDGDESAEVKYLQARSAKYVKQLKHSQLTKLEARSAYNMVFIPSLRYGLPSCSLTKQEIDSIQKPAVTQFLRLMGYEKGFPRDIAFSHQDFGGLQLPHLHSEMTSMKLEALITHIRANSALGQALRININTIQLLSGSALPILEHNEQLNYLDDNWILHLRSFIFEINAKILINDLWYPTQQREQDIFLMDKCRSTMNFNNRQFTLVNYWRIYFQVITLSDICEPDNTSKIQTVFISYDSNLQTKLNKSLLKWPNQQKPGRKGFQLWIQCLKQCFNLDIKSRTIKQSLGKWKPQHQLHNKWKHYYDPNLHHIYQSYDSSFKCYQVTSSRSRTSTSFRDTSAFVTISLLPSTVIPAHSVATHNITICKHISNYTLLSQHHSTNEATHTVSSKGTWKQYIKKLERWSSQLLKHSTILNEDLLYSLLLNSPIIHLNNDGGVENASQGTYGNAITNGTQLLYTAKGKCYNNQFYESAYRSECYAVLAGLVSYYHLLTYYEIGFNIIEKIHIHCDNKKLIRNIQQFQKIRMTVNDHKRPDFDLISEILHTIKTFQHHGILIQIEYVQGYKADQKTKKKLSHYEKMHKVCHNLAQQAKSLAQVKYLPFSQNNVNLIINNHHVHANIAKVTKKCYHSIHARQFLMNKYNWTNHTIDNIWWNVHAKAFKRLTFHDRIRIQKYVHNHCNTNHREHRYYHFNTATCNSCHHSVETEDHILQCQTFSRKQIRTLWLQEILNHCKNINNDFSVAITTGLKQWLEPTNSNVVNPIISSLDDRIQQAYQHQTNIGWNHFVRGRLSISWGNVINHLLNTTKNTIDTEQWGSHIASINFKYYLLLWELRCKEEHGDTESEIENRLKTKLIQEVKYIQQNTHPENDKDARIINYDIKEMQKQDSKHIQSWLIGARLLHTIHKKVSSITSSHFASIKEKEVRDNG